jgi:phosphatidylserine/phosphatidylglycerophosphate/cardiolipin synthase-like enzyme
MTMNAEEGRAPDRVVIAMADRRTTVIDIIRNAKRHIALSLFRCNDDAIFAELAAAAARGVVVDVITTSRAKGGRRKLAKLRESLDATGVTVTVYTDPVVKYHAKYLVADDGPAVVTSLNLTKKCFRRTCDAIVVTHDPAVVSSLRRLMAVDAARERMPDDLSERLVIGPERARRQFTSFITEARKSIRLIDAKLSDPDLVALLKTRRSEGVTVEVYDAKRIGEWKSHGKIMLIDEKRLVIGSLALAALSLDFRREIAIVVDEPAAVAEAIELFRTLNAAAAEAGTMPAGAIDGVTW